MRAVTLIDLHMSLIYDKIMTNDGAGARRLYEPVADTTYFNAAHFKDYGPIVRKILEHGHALRELSTLRCRIAASLAEPGSDQTDTTALALAENPRIESAIQQVLVATKAVVDDVMYLSPDRKGFIAEVEEALAATPVSDRYVLPKAESFLRILVACTKHQETQQPQIGERVCLQDASERFGVLQEILRDIRKVDPLYPQERPSVTLSSLLRTALRLLGIKKTPATTTLSLSRPDAIEENPQSFLPGG